MPLQEKLCECAQKNVTVTCALCAMSFCDDCDKDAHRVPAFRQHKRFPFLGVDSSKFCTIKDHEGNILTLYCKDCKTSICGGVCAHVEHKGHNFVPLKTAIGEIKDELGKLLIPYEKDGKELEAEIKKKQDELKIINSTLEEIKSLLAHTDKEYSFLALVAESKIWKNYQEKKIPEKRDLSWMETGDQFGGFRPLPSPDGVTRIWACVSKSTNYNPDTKYDPPVDYEWASSEMWVPGTDQKKKEPVYLSLGGWSGYNFKGASRSYFWFSDGKAFHTGWYPNSSTPTSTGNANFAGIFVYKSGTWDATAKKFK